MYHDQGLAPFKTLSPDGVNFTAGLAKVRTSPDHGTAYDIAGQDKANPIGTILAAAMMLRYSFDMAKEADAIEKAVSDTLDAGFRTADILPPHGAFQKVGCKQMGAEICARIQ